jgi:hypothetical protein
MAYSMFSKKYNSSFLLREKLQKYHCHESFGFLSANICGKIDKCLPWPPSKSYGSNKSYS